MPIDCRQVTRWRNTHCTDAASSPDLLASGTEWDWIEFFYAINNLASPDERWHTVNIFDAYLSACGGSATTPAPCTNVKVSWAGSADHASLVGGVNSLATEGFKSPAAALAFHQKGDDFGVSNLP